MDRLGVLLASPAMPYLDEELSKRFAVFRPWESSNRSDYIKMNSNAIRAIVGNPVAGADSQTINMLPNLEIVSTFSVGLDKIDLVKCRERGIKVTNTPDVLTDDVADIAIGLILATLRRICASDRYVRAGKWKKGDYYLTSKFSGKTVGIVGMGRIGAAIAKRAQAFRCPISYYSRTQKPDLANYKYYASLKELAADVQILVVACALTDETRHLINREIITSLGPEGVLVNIGRGLLVDEPELVSALVEGRLGGAGLDVFEHEPEAPCELFELENVVLLPHIGSGTWETRKAMADIVVGNLEAHALNQKLLTPVS